MSKYWDGYIWPLIILIAIVVSSIIVLILFAHPEKHQLRIDKNVSAKGKH